MKRENQSASSIFSDGGGTKQGEAAAAAIVRLPSGEEIRLAAYLGPATNNEGEIIAGLLGFAALRFARTPDAGEVRWVADSEYVLKSATSYINGWQKNGWKTASKEPVKNQGLWKLYLRLSRGFRIKPEHVRGHQGHIENEQCDTAATWVQECGRELFVGGKSLVSVFDTGGKFASSGWRLFDARKLLVRARADAPAEELYAIVHSFFPEARALEDLGAAPTVEEHVKPGKMVSGEKVAKKLTAAKTEVAVPIDLFAGLENEPDAALNAKAKKPKNDLLKHLCEAERLAKAEGRLEIASRLAAMVKELL
ncbi:MAG: ribonuclease HI [bacterium]|nr:ribonuclease HI [bacterium]